MLRLRLRSCIPGYGVAGFLDGSHLPENVGRQVAVYGGWLDTEYRNVTSG
ncbi:MAG: hypothetical protein K1V80_06515 [Muribaculaceae bacterium]